MLGDPGCFREYEARRVLLDIRCRTDTEMSLEQNGEAKIAMDPQYFIVRKKICPELYGLNSFFAIVIDKSG